MLLEACKRLLAQYPGKVSTTFPVYGVDEGFLGARASRPRSQGPITPPSRGSRRSRAGRRRLMRWGGQPIPATLPTSTSTQALRLPPSRGSRRSRAGRRRLMQWGGQPIPATLPTSTSTQALRLPPSRGSRRSRAGWRRLMRWGGQPIPATLPTSTSTQALRLPPSRGSRRSRRRRLMRWGVSGGRLLSKPTCTPWKRVYVMIFRS